MTKRDKAKNILRRLKKHYTNSGEFVVWSNPLELVVGTILSAQCTDKQVNKVTSKLFRKYISASDYANARITTLEKEIYSTGFYRAKAKYLKNTGKILAEKFNGHVPNKFDHLLMLPGVSNKTANLVMVKAFGMPVGVAVDTHVKRLSHRLGLTKHTDPKKIEADLNKLYKPKDYLDVNEYMIMHGRELCESKPRCTECPLQDLCPTGKKF